MRRLSLAFVSLALFLPSFAHAASFRQFTDSIVKIVNDTVVPLIYAIAFVLFLIGMVRFFFLGGEEGREKGKAFMLWGIIGLVVMFSVWGVVRLLMTALPQ
jgi:hypothetical protein